MPNKHATKSANPAKMKKMMANQESEKEAITATSYCVDSMHSPHKYLIVSDITLNANKAVKVAPIKDHLSSVIMLCCC